MLVDVLMAVECSLGWHPLLRLPCVLTLQVYKNVHSTVEEGGDEETRAAITAKVPLHTRSHCLVCAGYRLLLKDSLLPSLPPGHCCSLCG